MTTTSTTPTAVLIGDESILTLCGSHLLEQGWQVSAVVSSASAIKRWAEETGIHCIATLSGLRQQIDSAPDYLFSIANFQVLDEDLLSWPRIGAWNFHDGPLPEYGGLNTPSWALLNGETSYGVSWHEMTAAVDGGALWAEARFPLEPHSDLLEVNSLCFEQGFATFRDLIERLRADSGPLRPAAAPQRTYLRRQAPSALGFIDLTESAAQVQRTFRALHAAGYRSALPAPVLQLPERALVVESLQALDLAGLGTIAAGEVIEVDGGSITVACAQGQVRLGDFRTLHGERAELTGTEAAAGTQLPPVPDLQALALSERDGLPELREAHWLRTAPAFSASPIFPLQGGAQPRNGVFPLTSGATGLAGLDRAQIIAAVALMLARLNNQSQASVLLADTATLNCAAVSSRFDAAVPLTVPLQGNSAALVAHCESSLRQINRALPRLGDLPYRYPEQKAALLEITRAPLILYLCDHDPATLPAALDDPNRVVFAIAPGQGACLHGSLEENSIAAYSAFFELAIARIIHGDESLEDFELFSASDEALLARINETSTPCLPEHLLLPRITAAAARSQDAAAIIWNDQHWGYAQLSATADRIAAALTERGVAAGAIVGLYLGKSPMAVAAMLGILRCGAAYLPLDPAYPKERLRFIVEDSGIGLIIGDPAAARNSGFTATAVEPEVLARSTGPAPAVVPAASATAYVIYTSGSTGKPKGVSVTHGNVANFLLGMDQVIARKDGTMLSVTSLSFDISVLEIWWSLANALRVVIYEDAFSGGAHSSTRLPDQSIGFSLYYWNTNEERPKGSQAYALLQDGARFADEHRFEAVWLPERHFGSFGGYFPNPSVLAAAIATQTMRVQLRAGSVVAPLHHPLRIAEEWAVVDNLSDGRVGISFASGWMPTDFVLRPENFANAKAVTFETIEQVQRLWTGEALPFDGPGEPVTVGSLPRPVQPQLPVWVTAAKSPETFEKAGANGYNLLTHLLGQDTKELAGKIATYRRAWHEAGHAGEGQITLMLHTYLCESKAEAMKVVREPMKRYLDTSLSLIKDAAWDFPTFKKMGSAEKADMERFFENMSAEERDDLMEFAFQRYFHDSGLFGAVEDCIGMVDRLKEAGVDEIACLIDFGIDDALVMDGLSHLNVLRQAANAPREKTLAELCAEHAVTHLQCTPSQASIFMLDDESAAALAGLDHLLVGGEALNDTLADRLCQNARGEVRNMYGPTETTVWSSTRKLSAGQPVTIGAPIANTTLLILDDQARRCPVGVPGELYIGGLGVSDGYLGRPDLTDARFIEREGKRFYRTGDVVRMLPDGDILYVGRNDDQV
ncbi:MAG: MupA/Atu3671 family FMN-dependent luciferase-like monooxygenase, partial [Pseudomonadota bacterium]